MKQLALFLFTGVIAGCDRTYCVQGLALESSDSTYEFLERQSDLHRRAGEGARLATLRLRMFEMTDQGPKEWNRWFRFYPYEGREGYFEAVWLWGGWGERKWDRLVVEKEGYEPMVIPGAELTRAACDKILLIRMKKVP